MNSMFSTAPPYSSRTSGLSAMIVPAKTPRTTPATNTLNVTTISAQNSILDGHTPAYDIGTRTADSTLFNMTGSTPDVQGHPVCRRLRRQRDCPRKAKLWHQQPPHPTAITVTGSANAPPTVSAGGNLTVAEGGTLALSGSATDTDGDAITSYSWSAPSGSGITFADASSASTTFTAPASQPPMSPRSPSRSPPTTGLVDGTDTINVTVKDTSGACSSPPGGLPLTGESITIPVHTATGTYDVIWGDGAASAGVTGESDPSLRRARRSHSCHLWRL